MQAFHIGRIVESNMHYLKNVLFRIELFANNFRKSCLNNIEKNVEGGEVIFLISFDCHGLKKRKIRLKIHQFYYQSLNKPRISLTTNF